MSAAPASRKSMDMDLPEHRSGAIALLLLRLTLMGCAAALVVTLGSIVWKIAS